MNQSGVAKGLQDLQSLGGLDRQALTNFFEGALEDASDREAIKEMLSLPKRYAGAVFNFVFGSH